MLTMNRTKQFLTDLNLPSGDRYDLPSSAARFPDGGHYRIEIPSVEGPAAMEAVIEAAQHYGVPLHRVSQGSGMMLLTEAYRMSEVNFVTPFEYTGLIWATLWGFWVFGEIPAWTTMFGAVLIVGAGLYVLFGAKSPDVHAELS